MGYLIDSSVWIAHERGSLDLSGLVQRRIARNEDETFHLSVVTASELLHGVHRASTAAQRARRSAFVEAILDQTPLLPIDLPTARVHSELWAGLAEAGTHVGAHDLWIAASAVAHGLTLATLNRRHFDRVPGLDVADWST